jgi:hypothetical protein
MPRQAVECMPRNSYSPYCVEEEFSEVALQGKTQTAPT